MTDHIGVDSAEVDGDDGDVVAYGDGELDASDVGGGVMLGGGDVVELVDVMIFVRQMLVVMEVKLLEVAALYCCF